jgi:phosphopantetheinyl transferase
MPLVYQQNINGSTRLGVWQITEPQAFFETVVSLQRPIAHEQKRLQHLAGRWLLKQLFPEFPVDLIRVADTRRPFLEQDPFHFSISHAGPFAAAIVSTTERVGVDIEIPHPKIVRLKDKFSDSREREQYHHWSTDPLHQLTLGWSFKEAMYKWLAQPGVVFKTQLHVTPQPAASGRFGARCRIQHGETHYLTGEGFWVNDYLLTWVMQAATGETSLPEL